jgi:hypothetical protein
MAHCNPQDPEHIHSDTCYRVQAGGQCRSQFTSGSVRAPWEWNPPWEANVVQVPLPGYNARADLLTEFFQVVGQRQFKDEWIIWCSALWDCVLKHQKPRKVAAAYQLNRKTLTVYTCQIRTALGLN